MYEHKQHELLDRREQLLKALQVKYHVGDWRGVQELAGDLREVEAQRALLRQDLDPTLDLPPVPAAS